MIIENPTMSNIKLNLSIAMYSLLLVGCTDKTEPSQSNGQPSKKVDTVHVVKDTLAIAETEPDTLLKVTPINPATSVYSNPNDMVKDWENEDFVISCEKDYYRKELINDMAYYRGEWKNIKSPFIATYKGVQSGDYFHLIFEGDNDYTYDFGFGNNDLGPYELYEDFGHYNDNPKYLDQQFKVYWEWVISDFPCCSGDYYQAEAYMPSIVKLELITNDN
jgi:hypothetical protein